MATDGTVVALTAATGKEIWRFPGVGLAVGSPVVTGGVLLASTTGGTDPAGIVALEPSGGPTRDGAGLDDRVGHRPHRRRRQVDALSSTWPWMPRATSTGPTGTATGS